MKKNAVDNIVPIVIALKHKLEKAKSPLIDDLVRGQVCLVSFLFNRRTH